MAAKYYLVSGFEIEKRHPLHPLELDYLGFIYMYIIPGYWEKKMQSSLCLENRDLGQKQTKCNSKIRFAR